MAATFYDWEIPREDQPEAGHYAFDLDHALSSMVALTAHIPETAYTAAAMGTVRRGNGVVVAEDLVLTIGYLITEAEAVWVDASAGAVHGHVLACDPITGLGLVQTDAPLGLPALPLGDSRSLHTGDRTLVAAAGGRTRALSARLVARHEFAGYWEYAIDDALFTAPAHPYWGGAALIAPDGTLGGILSLRLETRAFAGKVLPMNMVVPVEAAIDLLANPAQDRPARPWLGIYGQDDGDRVVISGTATDGPARRAGLRGGDQIIAVGERPVTSLTAFYHAMWNLGDAGVDVPLRVNREGDVFDMLVRSADRSRQLRGR